MTQMRPVALRRLHPAIGEFVIQYASVQGTLRTLLLSLLRVNTQRATTLIYGMSDEVVLRKVQFALNNHGNGYRQFEDAIKGLREVAEFRNRLLHWVPNMNPARTTLNALVDAWRDYTNPNQPQLCFTPIQIRQLTLWLNLFEGDLIVMLMAISNKERFGRDMYRSIQDGLSPAIPKAAQVSNKKVRSRKKRPRAPSSI